MFELKTLNGKVLKLSDLKGKTVVLNFWATWCVPCIKEMSVLNNAYSSFKNRDVEIVAINFAESREKVEEFTSEHRLNFPVLLDNYGDTSQDYKIRGLPVTYFITPDGIVGDEIVGGLTLELIEEKLDQLAHLLQLKAQY